MQSAVNNCIQILFTVFFFLQYKWSAEDQSCLNLDLNDITTSTGRGSSKLVVRSNVLQPGRSYSFVLNVSQPGSRRWGGASLTIQASGPPRDGACHLSPESRIQLLETVVTYNCSGSTDFIFFLQLGLICLLLCYKHHIGLFCQHWKDGKMMKAKPLS